MIEKQSYQAKHISDIVGEWGNWQRDLTIFVFILNALNSYNDMSYSFHSLETQFWCNDFPKNQTQKFENQTVDQCFKFSNANKTCDKWSYDTQQFRTIISEYDLVCDRSDFASITQCSYMFGYLITGFILSQLADKYGRKPLVWVSFVVEIVALISCAFSYNVFHYSFSRFLLGLSIYGCSGSMCTSLLESCGPKHRSDIYMIAGFGWVFGYVVVPGMAYWLRDFQLMNYFGIIPIVVMMVWFYFIPESPRWLITNGHISKAKQTIKHILHRNQISDENFDQKFKELETHLLKAHAIESSKSYTILDLLKTTKLRKYTLIFSFSWMVMGLVYYGISLNMDDFGGNFYITFLLSGLVELPSSLISILALKYIPRKQALIAFQLIIAFSSLAIIPTTDPILKVTFALFGKFAVGALWWVYEIFVPEVYPTVLRNTGSGSASSFSRLGSMASPFMGNLSAKTSLSVVMILYAVLSSLAGLLAIFLPETKGAEIPDTLDEVEEESDSTV